MNYGFTSENIAFEQGVAGFCGACHYDFGVCVLFCFRFDPGEEVRAKGDCFGMSILGLQVDGITNYTTPCPCLLMSLPREGRT